MSAKIAKIFLTVGSGRLEFTVPYDNDGELILRLITTLIDVQRVEGKVIQTVIVHDVITAPRPELPRMEI